MTSHHPFNELTSKLPAKRKARVAARVTELKTAMALAELRQAREFSQQNLGKILGVNQPAVAKLEKRADMYVSNLRRYIEAMGGALEITAKFPDASVTITDFSGTGKGDGGG
jgi:DNA-binding XRE family transcriptional regulator